MSFDLAKLKYGIVQGRLVPPEHGKIQSFPSDWQKEHAIAASLGVEHIEWIVTNKSVKDGHPLLNNVSFDKCGVRISAICADWLVDGDEKPLDGFLMKFALTHEAAKRNECTITLPLMQDASLDRDYKKWVKIIPGLCEMSNVTLSLESDANVGKLLGLNRLAIFHTTLDIGNFVRDGIKFENFISYSQTGSSVTGNVRTIHIKDFSKKLKTSVALGAGNADLVGLGKAIKDGIFPLLENITFQTARAEDCNEVDLYKRNFDFFQELIK